MKPSDPSRKLRFIFLTIALVMTGCAGRIAKTDLPVTSTAPAATTSPTASDAFNHVVDDGDTCQFIAFTYNVSVQSVIEANGLALDCSDLYVGQVLRIPKPTPGVPAVGMEKLPLARAEELVRAQIFATNPQMAPNVVFPLIEVTTPEVWEQLGAQIYKVTGNVMLNQAFIIRSEQVTPIGQSFGGSGVHTLLVAELDGMPPAELVYAYEYGSGMRQSSLGAYHIEGEGVRAYEVREFRYPGALGLGLRNGVPVISGIPDAGGPSRELGTVIWADGRPVVVPLE